MNDMTEQPQAEEVTQISHADVTEAVRSTAILADLSISMWSAQRTDAKVSQEVKVNAGAVGNTGRYVKHLLAGADASLNATRSAYSAARAAHYALTLPWTSNPNAERVAGPRLLPNLLFERYITEMSALKKVAREKRDEFLLEYPQLIEQAQANLGGLAKADDYPSVDEIRRLFKLEFDFHPIPDRGGFANLPGDALEALGKQLHAKQRTAIEAAPGAMWARAKKVVEHFVERLADTEGRFNASAMEGVRELITLLPGFDVAHDPRVATVVSDITSMLDGIDSRSIRKSDSTRTEVLTQAQAVVNKLNSWGL